MFTQKQFWMIEQLIKEYNCDRWSHCRYCPFYDKETEGHCGLDGIRVEMLKLNIDK